MPSVGISNILLFVDGHVIQYQHGAERWHTLTWHQKESEPSIVLKPIPIHGQLHAIEKRGLWRLVKLLDVAKLKRLSKSMFEAEWTFKQGKKRYKVMMQFKEESHYHPLSQLVFRQLKQPRSLFS